MGIHIITDFNATAKLCAVSDDKHMEVLMEGPAGELVKMGIKMLAQAIYGAADGALSCEEIASQLEYDGVNVTAKDAAVVFLAKEALGDVQKELCALKVKEMLGGDEEGSKLSNSAMNALAGAATRAMFAAAEQMKEQEDEEDE